MFKKTLLLMALATAFSAYGGVIEGMDAKEAFAQFNYFHSGDCDKGNLKYNFTVFSPYRYYRGSADYTLNLVLILKPDGRGRLFDQLANPGVKSTIDFKWHVEKTSIVLEGVGEGEYYVYNGKPHLKLIINDDIKNFEGLGIEYPAVDYNLDIEGVIISYDQKTAGPSPYSSRNALEECKYQEGRHGNILSKGRF